MIIQREKNQNRRDFLKLLTTGSMLCLGCGYLGAFPLPEQKTGSKPKFQADSKPSCRATIFAITAGS